MAGRGQKLERTETTWKRLCRNSTVTAIRLATVYFIIIDRLSNQLLIVIIHHHSYFY